MDITAVVVIYNLECTNSITCLNLKQIQESISINTFIVDNSTIETGNEEFALKEGWSYISMNGNKGLSCAYNKAISAIEQKDRNHIIIWFDDDTEITKDYFEKLIVEAEQNKNVSIFVSIIRDHNGKIYSPNERGFFRNNFVCNQGRMPNQQKFNAINSCMAVRANVFAEYRYDENLFMDLVDQKFCEDQTQKSIEFGVIDSVIVQNFFQRSNNLSKKKVWNRYQIRIRDFMCYANSDVLYRWLGLVKVSAWAVEMGVKCKSPMLLLKCIGLGVNCAIRLSLGKKLR